MESPITIASITIIAITCITKIIITISITWCHSKTKAVWPEHLVNLDQLAVASNLKCKLMFFFFLFLFSTWLNRQLRAT